jgi:hypothetical protein
MNISLKQIIVNFFSRFFGLKIKLNHTNGLEKLAGTWSEEEYREFEANTAFFEKVDQDLWS